MQQVRERRRVRGRVGAQERVRPVAGVGSGALAAAGRDLEVRGRAHRAVVAWMAGVFGLCWFVLPLVGDLAGLGLGGTVALPARLTGIAAVLCLIMAALEAYRPRFHLYRRIDPVGSAALGILAVWAVTVVPFRPDPQTSTVALVAVTGLEALLFGVVLASFARGRVHAFVLGAAFEAVVLGCALAAAVTTAT